MTLPSDTDTQFEDVLIESVRASGDDFEIQREDGFSMFLPKPGFTPVAGQTARFYGRGMGYTVRGVVIDGRVAFYRSPEEQAAMDAEASREYEQKRRASMAETKIPSVVTPGFEWTEDMAEISGFGGGYERACRQMISQGCAWWSEHADANPVFHGYKDVYGICLEDNDDAKALSKAVAAGVDPSGAMHQAAISHVFHWRKLGSWMAYQNSMRQLDRERDD